MFDTDANSRALLDAQSPIGGFGKAKGDRPGRQPHAARLRSALTHYAFRSLPRVLGDCSTSHERERGRIRGIGTCSRRSWIPLWSKGGYYRDRPPFRSEDWSQSPGPALERFYGDPKVYRGVSASDFPAQVRGAKAHSLNWCRCWDVRPVLSVGWTRGACEALNAHGHSLYRLVAVHTAMPTSRESSYHSRSSSL